MAQRFNQQDGERVIVFEPCPKRVRVVLGGMTIADSTAAYIMLETGQRPVYYFPQRDVRRDLLEPSEMRADDPHKGTARNWHVRAGERRADNAAWIYEAPTDPHVQLASYVAFEWSRMDHWYEEDEEVFIHPRNPYKRVDCLHSSRAVSVVMRGQTLASSRRCVLLFETGLPTRYYFPREDVRLDVLQPSSTRTGCPYKGFASYYTVSVHEYVYPDLVWFYPNPTPECDKIRDRLCFEQERVERLEVQGEAAITVPPSQQ